MKFQKLILILFVMSLCFIVIVSVPNLKKSVKGLFLDDKRTILAKVQGKVSAEGDKLVILKIKQKDEIFIEVFKEEEKTEFLNFIQKISIPEKNEGSFTFQGEITNLAYGDVDHDGFMEILVPVFSEDMTPRLHTLKYNTTNNSFEVMSGNP